jgi:hypothetical protein
VINHLFKKRDSQLLPLAIVLCECILEFKDILPSYFIDDNFLLLDFLFTFLYLKSVEGEYARICFTYLISVDGKKVVVYLSKKGYTDDLVDNINRAYLDLPVQLECAMDVLSSENYLSPTTSNTSSISHYLSILSLLGLVIKRMKKSSLDVEDILRKLRFLSYKEGNTQLCYWRGILVNNSCIEISKKMIEDTFNSSYITSHIRSENKQSCESAFKYIKLSLFLYPMFSMPFFVSKGEAPAKSKRIIEEVRGRVVPDNFKEFIKKIKSEINGRYVMYGKQCNKNVQVKENLLDVLLSSKHYDLEILFIVFVFSKESFFYNFDKIKRLCENMSLEESREFICKLVAVACSS